MDPPILAFILVLAAGPLTLVLTHKWPKARRLVCGFWLLFSVTGFFSPAIRTVAWHVWHGNHILIENGKIHVPFRWIATKTQVDDALGKGVDLEALPSNLASALSLRGRPLALITLGPSLRYSSMDTSADRLEYWQGVYKRLHSNQGGLVTGPIRITADSQEVACLETVNDEPPREASASCLFLESGWTADFGGDPAYLDSFLGVVRHVSFVGPSSTQAVSIVVQSARIVVREDPVGAPFTTLDDPELCRDFETRSSCGFAEPTL